MSFDKENIKSGRELKKRARAEDVRLKGGTLDFVTLRQVKPVLSEYLDNALSTQRPTLEAEWGRLRDKMPSEREVTFEDVLSKLRWSLENRVKMFSRTNAVSLDELASDPQKIDVLCKQAAHDFIRSLHVSAKKNVPLQTAVEIASLSHWLEPTELNRLTAQYPDIPRSTIIRSMLSRPRDPDAFVKRYKSEVERLTEKYSAIVDTNVITHAALRFSTKKSPDAFIDEYIVRFRQLTQEYRERASDRVISYALLGYGKKAEKFIDWYIAACDDLLTLNPLNKGHVHELLMCNHFKTSQELKEEVTKRYGKEF